MNDLKYLKKTQAEYFIEDLTTGGNCRIIVIDSVDQPVRFTITSMGVMSPKWIAEVIIVLKQLIEDDSYKLSIDKISKKPQEKQGKKIVVSLKKAGDETNVRM